MYNKYIDELVKDTIYAHKKEKEGNLQKELLFEHMKLTYDYYLQMEKYKGLDKVVTKIINDLARANKVGDKSIQKVYELFKAAIYYHDIGKINPNFQRENMENDIKANEKGSTEHSLISARIYLDAFKRQIYEEQELGEYDKKETKFLEYIIYYFSYIISRHHSNLTDLSHYLTKLSIVELYDTYKIQYPESENNSSYTNGRMKQFMEVFQIDEILLYLLNELLYSCLVTSDFLSTCEFMTGEKILITRQKKENLFSDYETSELYQQIHQYEKKEINLNGMNQLRSDMFIEAEENMLSHLDKVIYYLEAPTGSGKTNMAINLSRILYNNHKEIKSINYIFPFNTLIDQTKETLAKYFKEYNDFIVINSCTPMVEESKEVLNYEMAYIKSEFRQFAIKLTSHVNLFDILFGTSKSGKYNLYDLVNSIIVLDEIQAYSNKIWREMITLLIKFASYLNIKIIIMSATLPKLNVLLKDNSEEEICSLMANRNHYFENSLFKDRVKLDFSLLNVENIQEALFKKIQEYKNKKVLVEFISKKSASAFYKLLKESHLENVYELTGDDNVYTREQIITLTKEDKPLLLVATQTIEAGVDIDMDIGFKDISYLDNEEQFLGRINRSSKKKDCVAYFFNLDNEDAIYKNDYRSEYTIKEEYIRKILQTKDFESYYKLIMEKIYTHTEKYTNNNIANLYEYCGSLNFKEMSNKLKLIDSNTIQIFLNDTITIHDEKIVGEEIWRQYKNIVFNNDISYARKQIELSKIKPKLNLFIYQIYKYKNSNTNYYDEEFGNIYYIQNGKEFMEDGKFNREKYISYTGGIFL
ncbi:MAG: CRISPR-associated helicase Cas3' [Clostridia bacterium]|nr:CRISPR-associated helicase Cas3' [Clostridia bacterium]